MTGKLIVQDSVQEGYQTTASGNYSHTEGASTIASGFASHAEGHYTAAVGDYSHAEGKGDYNFLGNLTIKNYNEPISDNDKTGQITILGSWNFIPGGKIILNNHQYKIVGATPASQEMPYYTCAIEPGLTLSDAASIVKDETVVPYGQMELVSAEGKSSHAEGSDTKSSGDYSHAEGYYTTASGEISHAEGLKTTALGVAAHAEGSLTYSSGGSSHAEGGIDGNQLSERVLGTATIIDFITPDIQDSTWSMTISPNFSGSLKKSYFFINNNLHIITESEPIAEDDNPQRNVRFAPGFTPEEAISITKGETVILLKSGATISAGYSTHAEGISTIAVQEASHAEGTMTLAEWGGHAEGTYTTASGEAHAEGSMTSAEGIGSHAEGQDTQSKERAHAEGQGTKANGWASHAEGSNTTAVGLAQHTQGQYNILDASTEDNVRGTYAHIVGNGTAYNNRSNAHTLDWNGNAWFSGDVYTGSTSGTNKDSGSKKLATEEYVRNLLQEFATLNNLNMPD